MHVIIKNAAGARTEHTFASLDETMGQIGPKYPCIVDGRCGHVEFANPDSVVVKFVETDPVFQYFQFAHLPPHLQSVSRPFYEQAERVVLDIPRNPERTAGLRKLLEAKDCIVRAFMTTQPTTPGGFTPHEGP